MARLNWNAAPRDYQMGVSRGVIYLQKPDGTYDKGVAWNGIKAITEISTGGTVSKIYADNMQYGSVQSPGELTGRIEVYDYPYELSLCNGFREPSLGTRINLQKRRSFGLCYRTKISKKDYLIHIIYGVNLNPMEAQYKTVNDAKDATVFGWEFFTVPSKYRDWKPTSSVIIDTRNQRQELIDQLEDILYGTEDTDPRLPTYEEIVELCAGFEIRTVLVRAVETLKLWIWDTFFFPNDSVPRAIHREAETRVDYDTEHIESLKRPGITYYRYFDEDISNPYPGRTHYSVNTTGIPGRDDSMVDAVEHIIYTSLIDTYPTSDGYVVNEYSIYYKEET